MEARRPSSVSTASRSTTSTTPVVTSLPVTVIASVTPTANHVVTVERFRFVVLIRVHAIVLESVRAVYNIISVVTVALIIAIRVCRARGPGVVAISARADWDGWTSRDNGRGDFRGRSNVGLDEEVEDTSVGLYFRLLVAFLSQIKQFVLTVWLWKVSMTQLAPSLFSKTISAITFGLVATTMHLTILPPIGDIALSMSAAVVPGAKFCA